LSFDGSQPILCRDDRFDHLLGNPDEDVLLGVDFIEGETFILAVVADELFLCKDRLLKGVIVETIHAPRNLRVQSTQYQQGWDTGSLQCTHCGIGFFCALRSESVSRAASKASLAFFSARPVSLLNSIRWTLSIAWLGLCGVVRSFLSFASVGDLRHWGSEQRSTVSSL